VSLGGNSYAAIKLAKNSVTSKTIQDGQVMRADLDTPSSRRVAFSSASMR
jgi:hypothetical protein